MKASKYVLTLCLLSTGITGCAMLGAIGSGLASLVGAGGSGNSSKSVSVNTELNTKVGDGSDGIGNGGTSKNSVEGNVEGEVTGANKYQATGKGSQVVINSGSWRDLLIIFGLIGLIGMLVMWHMPQPKWMKKSKKT